MSAQSVSEGTFFRRSVVTVLARPVFLGWIFVCCLVKDNTSPEFAGRSSLACSRLRDSRATGVEKARTRKKNGGNFSLFPAPPLFSRALNFRIFPTLSRLPHYLREQSRPSFATKFPNPSGTMSACATTSFPGFWGG